MESLMRVEKEEDSLTAPSEPSTTAATTANAAADDAPTETTASTTLPSDAPPLENEVLIEQDPGFVSGEEDEVDEKEKEEVAASVPKEDKKQDQDDADKDETAVGRGNGSHDADDGYLDVGDDVLLKHLHRQCVIVCDALQERCEVPLDVAEVSRAYERHLFAPHVPPKRRENGTCEPNPRLNFYPVFAVPEVLATYHIFFQNCKIPLSCRANRTRADKTLTLRQGAHIPDIASLEEVPKIFEGLGRDEKRAANALHGDSENESHSGVLVELEGDNARLAVLKRSIEVTHFAYPALNLPPKVMSVVMGELIMRRAQPLAADANLQESSEEGLPAVSDEQLARWLETRDPAQLEERRKLMMAAVLVTVELECLQRFFADPEMQRKLEETLHYTFRQGYVRQACKISNVELCNLVSYLGILHENRLGQNVLHSTLKGEARRDYIRDCAYLFLCYTWQTAMGVWQQCLEERNLKELEKLLKRTLRDLWTGFNERSVAAALADIIFPERLLKTLQQGLPDFTSQSMLQNFRTFILERSGILPATCCALPSDFVPIKYRECPPPLWGHCYLFQLANYLAYHSDLMEDVSGEGLLECHCRCNLCTPHRSLVCNPQLLSESQIIGTFELQGPSPDEKSAAPGLKLTPGLWTSAYLRKFVPEDYHAHEIRFYEDQSRPPKAELTACVITQGHILGQLQAINKARREFLLKKGRGVYLDPQSGEELNPLPPPPPQQRDLASQDGTQKEAAAAAAAIHASGGRGGGLGQSGRGGFGRGAGGDDGRLGGGQQPRRGSFRGRRGGRRNTITLGRSPLAGAPEILRTQHQRYNLRSSGAGATRPQTQP
ncbi:unnamed protein product [Simian adenovirus 40]